VAKNPTPLLRPIHVPPLHSPVQSNDQGSPRASTQSCNTEKLVLASPAAINHISSPINEDSLDAMEDDTIEDSPLGMGFDSHLSDLPKDDFAESFLNLDLIQAL